MRKLDTHDTESAEALDESISLGAEPVFASTLHSEKLPVGSVVGSAGLGSLQKPQLLPNSQLLPQSKNSKKLAIASAVCVFVLAGAATSYFQSTSKTTVSGSASNATPPPAVTVSVTTAKMKRVDDAVSVTGSVSAWDPLSVGAETAGMRITEVTVEEGDTVRRGQVLATLNSSVLKAQLVQAKARLASAEAGVKKSMQPNRPEEINALRDILAQNEAGIQQQEALRKEAKINYETAQVNAKRWAYLAKAGAASPLDAEAKSVLADTTREEVTSAEAKLKALRSVSAETRAKLKQAESGGRTEDVEISKATVAETKGQIDQFEHQIEQTYIKAPDDGLIAKRDAHIGAITSVGTPLFSIIRLNRLELRAQVSDIDLAKFKPGQLV